MPELDVMLEWSERISNVVGMLFSTVLLLQMLGDLLGINVFEALRQAITKPWVIPVEIIEAYYPLWFSMQVALIGLMFGDQIFSMWYMQTRKSLPPVAYERYMSLAMLLMAFWLALIYRYMTFTLITVFAAISFSYTMFIKKK